LVTEYAPWATVEGLDTPAETGFRPQRCALTWGMPPKLKSLPSQLSEAVLSQIPSALKETLLLRSFGLLKIPMLFFISPTVLELSDERCVVRVRLTRRSMNHLRSMYFGALSAGADCAGGLIAMRMIQTEGQGQVSLIFKDFHAEFLKRAEGDVHFTCTQGEEIQALVRRAITSGERENLAVHVIATVPSKFETEPVARFTLTLSLKRK
jgi:acyl-coenzyme A thioesterase PaaI-like protein